VRLPPLWQLSGSAEPLADATWLRRSTFPPIWPLHVGERCLWNQTCQYSRFCNFANSAAREVQLSGVLTRARQLLNNAGREGFAAIQQPPNILHFALGRVLPGSERMRTPPRRWSSEFGSRSNELLPNDLSEMGLVSSHSSGEWGLQTPHYTPTVTSL